MSDIKKVNVPQLAELIAVSVRDLSKEELEELLKVLKEEYGLEPMVQEVQVAAVEEEAKEQTEFDFKLIEAGKTKLKVVKLWNVISGKGLIPSKQDVESAPIVLKEGVSKEEAEDLKTRFEAEGATVEII